MNKILVNVFVPVLDVSYDIFIPLQSPMFEVLELIKKAVTEISDHRFYSNRDVIICERKTGNILDVNSFVYELGIGNGAKLMLI